MVITPLALHLLYFILTNPDSHLCTFEERGSFCDQQYLPVCATYTENGCSSPTGFCQKEISNGCSACNDFSVTAYLPGECSQVGTQICGEVQEFDFSTFNPNPVCAFSENDQGVLASTLPNALDACSTTSAAFYINDECPDPAVPLTFCKNWREGNYPEPYSPHCAYYTGGSCPENVCRITGDRPVFVCEDESVLFYRKGSCEGDETTETPQEEYEYEEAHVEELIIDIVDVQDCIPELEAVLQPDGTYLYVETKSCPEEGEENVYIEEEAPEQESIVIEIPIDEIEIIISRDTATNSVSERD
jgi:hypothetical protein